jgi:hypothetical protein
MRLSLQLCLVCRQTFPWDYNRVARLSTISKHDATYL